MLVYANNNNKERKNSVVYTYRKGMGSTSGVGVGSATSTHCTLSRPKEYAEFPGQLKSKMGVAAPLAKLQRK
jgi:hypothetical protein